MACKARAIMPDALDAETEVPVSSSVQPFFMSVVNVYKAANVLALRMQDLGLYQHFSLCNKLSLLKWLLTII